MKLEVPSDKILIESVSKRSFIDAVDKFKEKIIRN